MDVLITICARFEDREQTGVLIPGNKGQAFAKYVDNTPIHFLHHPAKILILSFWFFGLQDGTRVEFTASFPHPSLTIYSIWINFNFVQVPQVPTDYSGGVPWEGRPLMSA